MIGRRTVFWLLATLGGGAALTLIGVAVGATGWTPLFGGDEIATQIVLDIRLPRSLGAWAAGALLGLAGAIAQGLFRNPLADPYLLGSSAGAALAVALLLALAGVSVGAAGWAVHLGMTGAAFAGAAGAVALTLTLARGVAHTLRLLLAGVVVGVVLGAVTSLIMLSVPDILRPMQAFMLGSTGFIGWPGAHLLLAAFLLCAGVAVAASRALDALSLGDTAAHSLGVHLGAARRVLVATLALATGVSVAQAGLIAFVGLAAPHIVRSRLQCTHAGLLLLSAATGGLLLVAADMLARGLVAPQELPVGVITAVLGGGYLLWLMHRGAVRVAG